MIIKNKIVPLLVISSMIFGASDITSVKASSGTNNINVNLIKEEVSQEGSNPGDTGSKPGGSNSGDPGSKPGGSNSGGAGSKPGGSESSGPKPGGSSPGDTAVKPGGSNSGGAGSKPGGPEPSGPKPGGSSPGDTAVKPGGSNSGGTGSNSGGSGSKPGESGSNDSKSGESSSSGSNSSNANQDNSSEDKPKGGKDGDSNKKDKTDREDISKENEKILDGITTKDPSRGSSNSSNSNKAGSNSSIVGDEIVAKGSDGKYYVVKKDKDGKITKERISESEAKRKGYSESISRPKKNEEVIISYDKDMGYIITKTDSKGNKTSQIVTKDQAINAGYVDISKSEKIPDNMIVKYEDGMFLVGEMDGDQNIWQVLSPEEAFRLGYITSIDEIADFKDVALVRQLKNGYAVSIKLSDGSTIKQILSSEDISKMGLLPEEKRSWFWTVPLMLLVAYLLYRTNKKMKEDY